jgi:hypothetical protein
VKTAQKQNKKAACQVLCALISDRLDLPNLQSSRLAAEMGQQHSAFIAN